MRQNPNAAPRSGHDAESIPEPGPRITILERDIETVTELALVRFPSAQAETARIEGIRALLDAAADLRRAQDLHTHYLMVDHRGTPGSNDLKAAGRHLSRALEAYALALRDLADRFPAVQHAEPVRDRNTAEESELSLEAAGHNAHDLS